MNKFITRVVFSLFLTLISINSVNAQSNDVLHNTAPKDSTTVTSATDSTDLIMPDTDIKEASAQPASTATGRSLYQSLKVKFIEGNVGFMSLVALALIIGLTFCIERIIYLSLSEINTQKLLADIEPKILEGDIDGAKDICRETRGPVASICYQGLMHSNEPMENIERNIVSYGAVQSANMEKGCTWITLCIAIAPSLGFLGTVVGMVMAFEEIQIAGDISPTIVAAGMKVALITTIFGIIAALILQVFYNYVLTKIETITTQMEETAISLLDIIMKSREAK